MGMFRKMASMTTLGVIDFRSDKERTAAYGRSVKRQSKKQTKLMREQLERDRAQFRQPGR